MFPRFQTFVQQMIGIFQGLQLYFSAYTNQLPFLIHFLKSLKIYLYF